LVYTLDNARPILAVVAIIALCWLLSEKKRQFPLLLVLGGVAVQAGLVLALFAIPNSQAVLSGVTGAVDGLSKATQQGTQFVFSFLGGGDQPYQRVNPNGPPPFIFGFQVLPLILVISALSALLWHWGILKLVIRGFGLLFQKTMGIGGACATATAANIFMGMVESPIVIKAYLDKLTREEIFMMMVVGLGTVAGSTMVAYASILQSSLPNAAGHILVASIISAPAAIVLARVMIPENKGEGGESADYSASLKYESSMDAIARGVADGVFVCVNVAAMLIVFVAFVAIGNQLLALAPDVYGSPLTLERVLGWAFAPLAWLIGVPWQEAQTGGYLLGVKLFLTEFVAFIQLGGVPADVLSERSRMILAYALCGFANVGSVGVIVGGMTALFPPERRTAILQLAWKALLPGFLATCMTAAIVAALPMGLFAT
jgi:CNT family concentrative nucleoside transporter